MKIFGIGLPKTGTESLNQALYMLGYISHHNPRRLYATLLTGNYRLPEDEPWDALTHFGFTQYRALAEHYPDCKFILTVRGKLSWLESVKGQFLYFDPSNKHMERLRIDIFGTVCFDETQFSIIYDQHMREVTRFFNEIGANRWLMMDICNKERSDDEKWKELTEFLGMNPVVPGTPFPHGNNNAPMREELQKISEETGEALLGRRNKNGELEIIGRKKTR